MPTSPTSGRPSPKPAINRGPGAGGQSSLPAECTAIGRAVIRDLPLGLSQGWPVNVAFEYGANGRLSVQAVVSGRKELWTSLEIERNTGLSSEQPMAGSRRLPQPPASAPSGRCSTTRPGRRRPPRFVAGRSIAWDGSPSSADCQSVLQPGGNAPTLPQAVASLLSHAASGQWETVVRPDPPVSGRPPTAGDPHVRLAFGNRRIAGRLPAGVAGWLPAGVAC